MYCNCLFLRQPSIDFPNFLERDRQWAQFYRKARKVTLRSSASSCSSHPTTIKSVFWQVFSSNRTTLAVWKYSFKSEHLLIKLSNIISFIVNKNTQQTVCLVIYNSNLILQIIMSQKPTKQNKLEEELSHNINAQFGLTMELQRHLACENAQFVIEIARQMKFSYTIPTLALHIATHFFHKKSYVHYDRFLILAASVLLASKLKNIDCRLKNLCNSFYNAVLNKSGLLEPFNEDKMKKIKNYISIYESQILRTLQFQVEVTTPHEYLRKECETLFGQEKQLSRKIFTTTRIIILDSYRSRCCVLFSPLVIFACCFLIGCRYEGRKPYESIGIRQEVGEVIEGERLYQRWLGMLGQRYDQPITAYQVRDCLRMVNSVLLN